MKTRTGMAILLAMAFTVVATARAGEKGKSAGNGVFVTAADVKWNDIPGFPGLKMAVVDGDATKGPHHSMIKFTAGFAAPLHHHTSDHYVTVTAGTLVLNVDGEDHKLPAGSFFALTGKKKHVTTCEKGADCVLAIDCQGKWDVVPAEAKADSKKGEPKAADAKK
jgi:quercetin dioxygenase-like cupin family protein